MPPSSANPVGSEPGLLVLPEGAAVPPTAPSTTVVRVRPAASDEDEDLQQALARIPAPRQQRGSCWRSGLCRRKRNKMVARPHAGG